MADKMCDSCGGIKKLSGKSKLTTFICNACTDYMTTFQMTVEQEEQEFYQLLKKEKDTQ